MSLLWWLLPCFSMLVPSQQVSRTLDGDTFALYTIGIPAEEHLRVLGVNTPEMRDSLTTLSREARAFTRTWLAQGPFTITMCKRDSFGRYLATVSRGTDTLAVALIQAGLGVPYRP